MGFWNKFQFKPQLKLNPNDEQQRIIVENIKEKMDIYNDHFRNRVQNGKIKGSELKLVEDVPKISKHKFDIHGDYRKDISKYMGNVDRAVDDKYNYEAVLNQIGGADVNVSTLDSNSFIKNMPFPEHFAESLRQENAMLRDKCFTN